MSRKRALVEKRALSREEGSVERRALSRKRALVRRQRRLETWLGVKRTYTRGHPVPPSKYDETESEFLNSSGSKGRSG
eukprot:scaffold13124_cov70-Phaeocystis_antarctica.AAC.6